DVSRTSLDPRDRVSEEGHAQPGAQGIERRRLYAVLGGQPREVETIDAATVQVAREGLAVRCVPVESGIPVPPGILALADNDCGGWQVEPGMERCAGSVLDAVRRPLSSVRLEVRRQDRMPVA